VIEYMMINASVSGYLQSHTSRGTCKMTCSDSGIGSVRRAASYSSCPAVSHRAIATGVLSICRLALRRKSKCGQFILAGSKEQWRRAAPVVVEHCGVRVVVRVVAVREGQQCTGLADTAVITTFTFCMLAVSLQGPCSKSATAWCGVDISAEAQARRWGACATPAREMKEEMKEKATPRDRAASAALSLTPATTECVPSSKTRRLTNRPPMPSRGQRGGIFLYSFLFHIP
jgi:hypothetical protein